MDEGLAPTPDDMLAAIRRQHTNYGLADRWAFFEELRLGTGYGRSVEQRIDAFAVGLWASNWAVQAYELKVSRSDFLRELKKPLKRRMALRYSNLFWFVTPVGLVKVEEVPIEAGLVEVKWGARYGDKEQWYAHITVPAPWRDVPPPTWSLFASVARRVRRNEDDTAALKQMRGDWAEAMSLLVCENVLTTKGLGSGCDDYGPSDDPCLVCVFRRRTRART